MSQLTLFEQLFSRNVNDRVETKEVGPRKTKLSYLSWAWAWAEIKKVDPNATSIIHEFPLEGNEHIMVPYLKTPNGYFVKVSVTVQGQTETEWLPVMDENNNALGTLAMVWSKEKNEYGKSFKVQEQLPEPTAMEINKAHKRCLVKAIALHGLGLYIFSGEDLPETIVPRVNEKQLNELRSIGEKVAALVARDLDTVLEAYKVHLVETEEDYNKVKTMMESKIEKMKEEAKQDATA